MDSGMHPHPGDGQLCQLAKCVETRKIPPAIETALHFVHIKPGWSIFLPGTCSYLGYLGESDRMDLPGTGICCPGDQVTALPISKFTISYSAMI